MSDPQQKQHLKQKCKSYLPNIENKHMIQTARPCKNSHTKCSFNRAKAIPRDVARAIQGRKATIYNISECKSTSPRKTLQLPNNKTAQRQKDDSKRRCWVDSTNSVVLLDDKPPQRHQTTLGALVCKAQPKHEAFKQQPRFLYMSFYVISFVHLSWPFSWRHDLWPSSSPQ